MEPLIHIAMENTDEISMELDVAWLLGYAAGSRMLTPIYDAAWAARIEADVSQEVEDLASDFIAAGHTVDFDEGPFITIWMK